MRQAFVSMTPILLALKVPGIEYLTFTKKILIHLIGFGFLMYFIVMPLRNCLFISAVTIVFYSS